MHQTSHSRKGRLCFLLITLLTLLPLLIFPLESFFYHELRGMPQIKAGTLDLDGHTLANEPPLPLDGIWAFYPGRWIIAEGIPAGVTPLQTMVPEYWWKTIPLANEKIGSFRLLLQNVPSDTELVAFIPHISAHYRCYINGTLVAAQGNMDILPDHAPHPSQIPDAELLRSAPHDPDGTAEVVLEIASPHMGGLYKAPLLSEWESNHIRYDLRGMVAAALLGITAITLCGIAILLLMGNKLFFSRELLLINLFIFLRILLQNNYFFFLKIDFLPYERFINSLLQAATLFLPAAFLLCARQLIQIPLKQKILRRILIYEAVWTPIVFLLALSGRTRLSFLCSLLCYLPFSYVMWMVYRAFNQGIPHSLSVAAVLLMILSSMLTSSLASSGWLLMDVSLFAPALMALCLCLQFWIFMRRSITAQQQVIEAENLRLRLYQSESALMLSQIKPHFLYNTLLAIQVLCTQSPETAAEATRKFAVFLRTHMNSISSQSLIPFEKELLHIRNYTDIEELRYQSRLTICYDIQTTAFSLPPLTIQPLVENAIRHGACKNIAGGTVTVKSSEQKDCFLVEISDDGPGFHPTTLGRAQTAPHGLENISLRLWTQRQARVDIVSAPGQGTQVRVTLPKEVPDENNFIG